MCGSRKYPYPPPTEGHWKFQGGGGVKPRNFRGVEGVHGQLLFQRVKKHEKNKQHTIETKHEEILTYVVLKQKNKAPFHRDEVYIISFNVSVFHSSFLALASAYKDASFFVTESKWRT